jgi:hypothetical protein
LETELHRTLKQLYAADSSSIEQKVGRFRVDAIDDLGRLVEVQHASLAAIRDKIGKLLNDDHTVRLVKPVIALKWITTVDPKSRKVIRRRRSPKRGTHRDIFRDLLHFTRVFPHRQLILEVPLIEMEEIRQPRIKRWRRAKPYQVLEQKILSVGDTLTLKTLNDLLELANLAPGTTFDTATLAEWLTCPRWFAQQIAYVLHRCQATIEVGKKGNAKIYQSIAKPSLKSKPIPIAKIHRRSSRRSAA